MGRRTVETIAGSALRQSRECLEARLGKSWADPPGKLLNSRRAIAEHTRQLSGVQLMCGLARQAIRNVTHVTLR